jgi:hypothetical protein
VDINRRVPLALLAAAALGPGSSSCSSAVASAADASAPVSAAGSASSGPPDAGSPGATADPQATLARLRRDTGVDWDLWKGNVLRARGDSGIQLGPNDPVEEAALRFLSKYGGIFRIQDARSELVLHRKHDQSPGGIAIAFFDQVEHAVPVYRIHVTVVFNVRHQLSTVGTGYIPGLQNVPVVPSMTPAAAEATARADAAARFKQLAGRPLVSSAPQLIFYPLGTSAVLAYRFGLGASDRGPPAAAEYVLDANTGQVIYAENGVLD